MSGKGKPRRVPKLCHHKRSGQGFVTDPDTHRQVPFGKYGTDECAAAYDAWRSEFLARKPGTASPRPGQALTVAGLARRYMTHAESYYVKRGEQTSEVRTVRSALRYLVSVCPETPADGFSPKLFKQVRQSMIDAGLARSSVNALAARIRHCWRWGVEEELVRPEVYGALLTVPGVVPLRTAAREPPRVPPAAEEDVAAVLPHLPRRVQALVKLQRLAGMRPGEVVSMRAGEIDRDSEPWVYRPGSHKKEHHGQERVIYLGPKCREILAPLLENRRPGDYLFPTRARRGHYRVDSYHDAVERACKRAGVEPFAPNRLRHAAATEVRAKHGIEAVAAVLGHTDIRQSLIYAERNEALARKIAEDIG